MEKKMYELNGCKVYLEKTTYANNKRLAVQAYVVEDDGWVEPYATISVNLPNEKLTDDKCTFVDGNNVPFIEEWLEKNGIAEPTGRVAFSGFCIYSEMRFK